MPQQLRQSIIAIDPGRTSGVVVLSVSKSPKLLEWREVKMGLKSTPPLVNIIGELARTYDIVRAAIEDQFLLKNINSLIKLSRNSGRWEEACISSGIQVEFVNPKNWQSAIFGRSARRREQLKVAATAITHAETKQKLPVDVCDAYCIGRYVAVRMTVS